MKKIVLIILLISAYFGYSQHPDLQDKRWYLTNMTIDVNYTEPIYDPLTFPFIKLEFVTGGFTITANQFLDEDCEIGFVSHIDFTATDVFEFIDITPVSSSNNCTPYMVDFMNEYLSFYYNYTAEIFTYNITNETDGSKSLTITNFNGDEVNFTDTFLNLAPEGIYETFWYLHNLIIDGIDNIPPVNEELLYVPMSFHEPNIGFRTQGCISFMWADANFFTATSMFYLYNLHAELYGCSDSNNEIYQELYFDFFINNLPQSYGYSYSNDGTEKTLIITDSNGDQAIYKNWIPLDIQKLEDSHFNLYPNPVQDFLYVEYSTETIDIVEVLDILGKTLKTKTKDFTQLDFSNYTSGVYFVKFYAGETVLTKKVVKK